MIRVAIIGAGPKALHALERLVVELREVPGDVQVDTFDPSIPGAGPAYAPTLDPALLMNLRSGVIDAWPRVGRAAVALDDAHPDLVRWCERRGLPAADYLPRTVVGHYLADAWARVIADAPAGLRIRHHRHHIGALAQDPGTPGAWWLGREHADRGPYDEVLLATGHGAPAAVDARSLPLDDLAARRLVGVRGAGLTALDLVRGLEARRHRDGLGPHVLLVSRTGRPLTPKPEARIDALFRGRLDERRGAVRPSLRSTRAIEQVLIDDATALLREPVAAGLVAGTLADLRARAPMDQAAALAAIDGWIDSATAGDRDDPVLALGAAWRWRYPQLVAQASEGGLAPRELAAFRRLAAAMEPVAFGPPVSALASLHRALEAGWVTLAHAPTRLTGDGSGGVLERPGLPAMAVDAIVDAVLPSPGLDASPLLRQLAAQGLVERAAGGRGVRVAHDGTPLVGHTPQRGLAVIGRATEDWIIGNDTLDRALHGVAGAWATRVAAAVSAGAAREAVPA